MGRSLGRAGLWPTVPLQPQGRGGFGEVGQGNTGCPGGHWQPLTAPWPCAVEGSVSMSGILLSSNISGALVWQPPAPAPGPHACACPPGCSPSPCPPVSAGLGCSRRSVKDQHVCSSSVPVGWPCCHSCPLRPTVLCTARTPRDWGAPLAWTSTRCPELYPAHIVGATRLEELAGPLAQAGHLEEQLGGAQLVTQVDDVWKSWGGARAAGRVSWGDPHLTALATPWGACTASHWR